LTRSSTTTTNTRPYSPIPSPLIATPTDELPILAESIIIAPSRSLSSTPKNPIDTILFASTTPTFNWIDNHQCHIIFDFTCISTFLDFMSIKYILYRYWMPPFFFEIMFHQYVDIVGVEFSLLNLFFVSEDCYLDYLAEHGPWRYHGCAMTIDAIM